jgi:hypothetical protein
MPATYTHFQCLDRDFNFFKTRMGTTVCSSLGLTSLIPRIFKRLSIKKDILKRIEKSRSGCLFSRAKWWNDRIDGNTKVFPCFSLSCKANARVKLAKTGHGQHSSKFVVFVFCSLFVLFCC